MNAHNAALGGTPQRLKRGIPLALRGVARRFGEREVLKDIDLLVPAGQFVAIVGRSGCGQSTCCACWPASTSPAAASCWPARRRWPRPARTPG